MSQPFDEAPKIFDVIWWDLFFDLEGFKDVKVLETGLKFWFKDSDKIHNY
jgi:hypothetical protein